MAIESLWVNRKDLAHAVWEMDMFSLRSQILVYVGSVVYWDVSRILLSKDTVLVGWSPSRSNSLRGVGSLERAEVSLRERKKESS